MDPTTKNTKNPEQPIIKRPLNAFIIFSKTKRAEAKKAGERLLISEKLSVMWKALTAEEKAPWLAEAEKMRQEHKKNHPDFKFTRRRKPRCPPSDFHRTSTPTRSSPTPPEITAPPSWMDFYREIDADNIQTSTPLQPKRAESPVEDAFSEFEKNELVAPAPSPVSVIEMTMNTPVGQVFSVYYNGMTTNYYNPYNYYM